MSTVTAKQMLFFILVLVLFYIVGMIVIKGIPEKWNKSGTMVIAALVYTISLIIAYYIGGVQNNSNTDQFKKKR